MMGKLYSIILALLLVVGCTSVRLEDDAMGKKASYSDFGGITELHGEVFDLDTVWRPTKLFLADSLLCLIDRTCDRQVQIFSKNNRGKVGENIPYGIGPNESLSCWTLQIGNNNVHSFDLTAGEIRSYNKNSFLLKNDASYDRSVSIGGAADIVALKNGNYVAYCLSEDKTLLELYDSSGSKLNVHTDFPKMSIGQSFSDYQMKRCFETRLYYNEKNDRIFVTYSYTDLFDIYDSNLKLLHRIHGPDQFIPEFKGDDIDIAPTQNTKYSSVCSCLTDNYIWVLYFGSNTLDSFADKVLVFDYQGNPKKVYHLDIPILGIAADESEKTIYGIAEHPEFCVIKFNYEKHD